MRRSLVLVAVLSAAWGCRRKAEAPPPPPPLPAPDASAVDGPVQPAAAATGAAATGASADAGTEGGVVAERKYELERVGDHTVIAMHPDGFEKLPLERKILAYHLYRAAIAGDPIFYDQHYRHNPAIKGLLEAIVRHPEGIDAAVLEKVRTYLKQFWINHGIHDAMNGDKLLPAFTFDELAAAAGTVAAGGAEVFGTTAAQAIAARLEELRGPLFDPRVDPFSTRRTVPEGMDLLTASSNNLYDGVTMADLEGFDERYALNSKLVKEDGRLVEEIYRTGAGNEAEPGLYAAELRAVVRHLEEAMKHAGDAQRQALAHLVRYFVLGDPEAFRDYNIAWVADDPPVDAILGFIEVYADPRNQKGAWEGVVFVPDAARGAQIRALARNAPYFESKLPYAEEYKRTEFNPPLANLVVSLVQTGDAGPVGPAGINLPNAQEIRERYGSKSIDIANLNEAIDAVTGERAIREFSFDDAERDLGLRCRTWIRRELIGFHEVIGHGSGRVSPDLAGDPADHLPGYYNAIEEARADLVALHLAFDPKTIEIGMIPDAECATAIAQAYVRSGLLVLRRLPPGGIVEEDHWRATMLIVRRAIDRGAVRIERRDGRFFLVLDDVEKWRTTVAELLAELMRIKATGDLAAGRHLVETFGARYEEAWRDDVMRRIEAIGYPKKYAFVSPILRPVTGGADGGIVDVAATPAASLEEMEWEWNRCLEEDRAYDP